MFTSPHREWQITLIVSQSASLPPTPESVRARVVLPCCSILKDEESIQFIVIQGARAEMPYECRACARVLWSESVPLFPSRRIRKIVMDTYYYLYLPAASPSFRSPALSIVFFGL